MSEKKKTEFVDFDPSTVISIWNCPLCKNQKAFWTFIDFEEKGGPVCEQCEKDMVLVGVKIRKQVVEQTLKQQEK